LAEMFISFLFLPPFVWVVRGNFSSFTHLITDDNHFAICGSFT
jgi:hypothetical protein